MMCIGADEVERATPQRVMIDVDLFVPFAVSTSQHDRLNEVLDYDVIRQAILQHTQSPIHLQETLCDRIAHHLLAYPKVRAVRVRTQKPNAYPDCASVGVEVFHINKA
jgi:dihydroneopterin aldolase